MLKLYHTAISPNSRRVWIALLEKGIEFELVEVELMKGEQLQPEFLALNPFHHIPVLVDDGFSVIESLAILDYIESKYPSPPLLPSDTQALAKVRMVEMVTMNEFMPAMSPLLRHYIMNIPEPDSQKLEQCKEKCHTVLSFFEKLIGSHSYFGGEQLSLADIVAGVWLAFLPQMEVPLDKYPGINALSERLTQRPTWQQTQPSPKAVALFISRMQARMAVQ